MTNPSGQRVSRWVEIREAVRHRLIQGTADEASLSDSALAEEFGVSRMTVRQALKDLVNEGLLIRERGRGTRISRDLKIIGRHPAFGRFPDDTREQGHVASIRLLLREVRSATSSEASQLNIVEGDPIDFIRRLRCADGQAIAVDERVIPISISHGLTDEELTTEPLWQLIERRLAIVPAEAEVEMAAIAATPLHARWLGVKEGEPLLTRQTRVRARDGRIMFYGCVAHHPERYPYRMTVPAGAELIDP